MITLRNKLSSNILGLSTRRRPRAVKPWWHHQKETFFAFLALRVGNSLVTSEFPSQRPVTWSFDVFLDLRLNKRLSKQSICRWFKTSLCSLWLHCNVDHKCQEQPLCFQSIIETLNPNLVAWRFQGILWYMNVVWKIITVYSVPRGFAAW